MGKFDERQWGISVSAVNAVGHPFCGAPALRIGHICHRGSGGPRFPICAEHLEALTADED